jgi:hypothetical protein
MVLMGTIICLGLFSLTWNPFIFLNMVFSQFLYGAILLEVLEVLIERRMDNIKCHL